MSTSSSLPNATYFQGPFGDIGVVVYLGSELISPSWCVWMVPGAEYGIC